MGDHDPQLLEADALLVATERRTADPVTARRLYLEAMASGSGAAALRVSALAAYGFGCAQDWNEALHFAAEAAMLGSVSARSQLALLAGQSAAKSISDLRVAIDVEALLTPPLLERLSREASLGVSRGFAPPGFSEWLIERAVDGLEPGYVDDSETGRPRLHPMRTAHVYAFGPQQRDLILAVMQERASRIAKIPISQHEAPNAISYETGQHYQLHVDYTDPNNPQRSKELEVFGQRVITLVTYLNDDFEGGETDFPALGVRFRGRRGDAVAFSNVLPNGHPDELMVHAGLPPTRGRKWVLSQWLRNRPQPFA